MQEGGVKGMLLIGGMILVAPLEFQRNENLLVIAAVLPLIGSCLLHTTIVFGRQISCKPCTGQRTLPCF